MMRSNPQSRRGFSLLELLIVVAIILIIATIAIPSFLRSRQAANETAAATSMKSINVAENVYMMTNHVFGSMDTLIANGLLDDRFTGPLAGYNFGIMLSDNDLTYEATATAVSNTSGRYDYYTSLDYVIRYSTTPSRAPAGRSGNPVQ